MNDATSDIHSGSSPKAGSSPKSSTGEASANGGGIADPLAGRRELGRYRILRELGRGAMGVVYEAVDPRIGRKVALKLLTSVPGVSEAEMEEFRSRFYREARTAGMLSHPNIVVVHDVDHDEELGISYMAMESLAGQSLYDLLRSGVKLTREQALDTCIQVAEGLDHAHRQGIIHRDVKPANLMILEDGTVKIMDFGIAKISTSNLTRTGQFLGTPNYMSPEQVIGHVIDGRSDLFSLGIILYELLTGEKPFMGSSLTTITYQIVNVDPIEPSKIQPGIPKVFDAVVARLLRKAPDERFQTGKEVADALRALKDGTADVPLPAPSAAAGAAAARATGDDATEVSLSSSPTAAPTRPSPDRTARPSGLGPTHWLLGALAGSFLVLALVLAWVALGSGEEPDAAGQGGSTGADVAGLGTPSGGAPEPGSSASPPEEAAPVGGGAAGEARGEPAGEVALASGGEPEAVDDATSEPAGTDAVGSAPEGEPSPEAAPARPRQPASTEPRPRARTAPPEAPSTRDRPVAEEASSRPPSARELETAGQGRLFDPQAAPMPLSPSRRTGSPSEDQQGAPGPELRSAPVRFVLEHKLKEGTVEVKVDGEPVVIRDFTSARKRGGTLSEELEVVEGQHAVEVCLSSPDMKDSPKCAHRQHSFVMDTRATIRAEHLKPFIGPHKFLFEVE